MGNQEKIIKVKPFIIKKGWGHEEVIANEGGVCGKLLFFKKAGYKGSMHFHLEKLEFFRVGEGVFKIECIDPTNAERFYYTIKQGECIKIPRGHSHRIICIEAGYIIEFSTPDFTYDSYRVEKGDSQK